MIAIVFTFEEPEGPVEDIHASVEAIVEAVKKRVSGTIPNVKGYVASHEVAEQVTNIFKAASN
jgi:hypothetical protein